MRSLSPLPAIANPIQPWRVFGRTLLHIVVILGVFVGVACVVLQLKRSLANLVVGSGPAVLVVWFQTSRNGAMVSRDYAGIAQIFRNYVGTT